MADGEALFFIWSETAGEEAYNPLQKHAYTSRSVWSALGADRACDLEAGAVFVAGLADGRISLGADMALHRHVGDFAFVFGHLVMVILMGGVILFRCLRVGRKIRITRKTA